MSSQSCSFSVQDVEVVILNVLNLR